MTGNGNECSGAACCPKCANPYGKCCMKLSKKIKDNYPNGNRGFRFKNADSMGFNTAYHVDGTGNQTCHGCRVEMGLPVGRTPAEQKLDKEFLDYWTKPTIYAKGQRAVVEPLALPKQSSTKRPPTEVHIKDIETALHNTVCRDMGAAKSSDYMGADLFDSHRKAANALIEQLKIQGIKLVPDPDFEDKPKQCRHGATTSRFVDKNGITAVRTGYKCSDCGATANFS